MSAIHRITSLRALTKGNVARASFVLTVGTGLASIVFAVFTVMAARYVRVTDFGLFSGLYGIALLSTDISDYGTGVLFIVGFARRSASSSKLLMDLLLSSRICLHVAFFALWLLVPAVESAPRRWDAFAAAATLALLLSLRATLQAEMRGQQRYASVIAVLLVERVAAVVVLFLVRPGNAAGCLLCLAAGCGIATIPVLGWRRTRWTLRGAVSVYREALPYGAVSTISDLNNVEIPLVSAVAGGIAAGYFSAPSRLLNPLSLIGSSISSVLVREAAGPIESDRLSRMVWRAVMASAICVGLIASVVACTAPFLVPRLLGRSFEGAVVPTQIGCLTAVFVAAVQPFTAAMQAQLHGRLTSVFIALQMGLYLVCVGAGASLDGATGAAAGAAIASGAGLFVAAKAWQRINH